MSRVRQISSKVFALVASAGVTMIIQIVAILFLSPLEYGHFSVSYLCFALGSAAVYSLVCEPWILTTPRSSGGDYFNALVKLTAFTGLIVVCLTGALTDWGSGTLAGAAVALAMFRLGSRYYSVVEDHSRFILFPDVAGVSLFLGTFTAIKVLGGTGLQPVLASWTVSGLAAAILSEHRRTPRLGSSWARDHWQTIRPLLTDSILLEVSNSGTSAILAPWMGVSDFGVYRSISSAAAPVRLVLTPARPYIARLDRKRLVGVRVLGTSWTAGLAIAALVYGGLTILSKVHFLSGSAIMGLVGFKLPAATFVMGNTVSTFYYFALRSLVGGRNLLTYRIAVMVLSLAMPLTGWALARITGAVWGYALVSCLTVPLAWIMLRRVGQQRAAHP